MSYTSSTIISQFKTNELRALSEYLNANGVQFLQKFINNGLETSTKTFLERKPTGLSLDYYYWGYNQAVLEVHNMYKQLARDIKEELDARKTDEPIDLPVDKA